MTILRAPDQDLIWREKIVPPPMTFVNSFNARVGNVLSQLGDYAASLVGNDSSAPGATTKDALDALNSPTDNWRYVSPNGSDVTGAGTLENPWASVTFAMAQITTALVTKRFTIWVMGRVTEAGGVVIKPNVFIAGVSALNSRVSATSWSIDAAWTPAGDHRSGFVGLTVNGAIAIDWNAFSANEGKFYFHQCWVNSAATFSAFSAINQVYANGCLTFANWTCHGVNVLTQANIFQGDLIFDEATSQRFLLTSAADSFLGLLSMTKVALADGAQLNASFVAALTIAGALTIDAAATAIPAAPTLSGGALINNLTVPRTAGTGSCRWLSGAGTPEAAVIGSPGELYSDTTAGKLYVKQTGVATNTGWHQVVVL